MGGNFVSVLFSRPVDLDGWFGSLWLSGATERNLPVELWTCSDSTNGVDGSWVLRGTIEASNQLGGVFRTAIADPDHRSFANAQPLDLHGVTAAKLRVAPWAGGSSYDYGSGAVLLQLYGTHSESSLVIERVDGSALPTFWGDIDHLDHRSYQIRVRNTGDTIQRSVAVGMSGQMFPDHGVTLPVDFPLPEMSFRFSLDSKNWSSRVLVGDIEPGSVSAPVFLKMSPVSGTVGPKHAWVAAQSEGVS